MDTWVYYFEPKHKCPNRVWATKNAVCPSIAKRQGTVKKILYVIFFDNKGPVMQLPAPKGRTVTGAFYKIIVLKKLKAHFKGFRSKTGLKYLPLLHEHDNASAHKAYIVTEFLESDSPFEAERWISHFFTWLDCLWLFLVSQTQIPSI